MDQLKRDKRLPMATLNEELAQHMADAEEAQEETIQLLNRAMGTLSAKEQTLLRLKYEEGKGVEAIGRLQGMSPSAVKMRLKRSRAKIEQFYQIHTTH